MVSLVTEFSPTVEYLSWAWPGLALLILIAYNAVILIPASRAQVRSVWGELPSGETLIRSSAVGLEGELLSVPMPGCDTVDKVFARTVDMHGPRRCMGERAVEEEIKTWNEKAGKNFVSYKLAPYAFLTYDEVAARVRALGSGLNAMGVKRGDTVAIYANTCASWQIMAQACFARGIVLATAYANLGDDALVHVCNETESIMLITDTALLPNVASVADRLETVTSIVYLPPREGIDADLSPIDSIAPSFDAVLPLADLESMGEAKDSDPEGPDADDVAVVMYTSGSTGTPKGVLLPHRALVASIASLQHVIVDAAQDDVFIAFLPLAHILELVAENTIMAVGATIGYASSLTLSDTSTGVAKGQMGDIRALRPTLMASVPLVLDRVKDGVMKKVSKSPLPVRILFKTALAYCRIARVHGWSTPIFDALAFGKIRAVLGGRLRLMISGGAALSSSTQAWFTTVISPLGQGWGLSETCGGGTTTHPDDTDVGVIGAPIQCAEIKLVDWETYKNANNPPQGELWIAGPHLADGYLKLPEKTEEEFSVDERGTRWFHTGDIGQLQPNGVLKIVDRRKNLVKGKGGEYLSYGKVESVLRASDLVDNIMVHQDSDHFNPIAVVTFVQDELVAAMGDGAPSDAEELAASDAAKTTLLKELKRIGLEGGMKKFEIPTFVVLEPEPWTPESDLVTAALKLKRKNLMTKYRQAIDAEYQ